MRRERFTRQEAENIVGRSVRSLIEFSGVPKGRTGRVIKADEEAEGYTVVVEWDLIGRTIPLVDWFDKVEYEQYLIEA